MINDKIAGAEAGLRVRKLTRLYYWFAYQRFTGLLYGGPWMRGDETRD
ncbi:MAG: hypothetical protein M1378_02635 [Bacteroidetes bacterium]|nr:hypothetical protein [Bacteroidota bacterium]